MINKSIKRAVFFILFLGIGSFAFGACDINIPHGDPGMSNGQYNTWRTRIANSSNAALRQAYVDGECTIRKGPHYGGHVPSNANDPHITVRIWGGSMCHVFTKNGQQTYFPTTCF